MRKNTVGDLDYMESSKGEKDSWEWQSVFTHTSEDIYSSFDTEGFRHP